MGKPLPLMCEPSPPPRGHFYPYICNPGLRSRTVTGLLGRPKTKREDPRNPPALGKAPPRALGCRSVQSSGLSAPVWAWSCCLAVKTASTDPHLTHLSAWLPSCHAQLRRAGATLEVPCPGSSLQGVPSLQSPGSGSMGFSSRSTWDR
ncbi:hypothetical protein MJT46_016760 [Ovis ammon polii x Ovis aries]|nr:hypothetical protein MJT46_016760 [Ovis ammon polii x Ovis aries]